jgi:hypothetical protein
MLAFYVPKKVHNASCIVCKTRPIPGAFAIVITAKCVHFSDV